MQPSLVATTLLGTPNYSAISYTCSHMAKSLRTVKRQTVIGKIVKSPLDAHAACTSWHKAVKRPGLVELESLLYKTCVGRGVVGLPYRQWYTAPFVKEDADAMLQILGRMDCHQAIAVPGTPLEAALFEQRPRDCREAWLLEASAPTRVKDGDVIAVAAIAEAVADNCCGGVCSLPAWRWGWMTGATCSFSPLCRVRTLLSTTIRADCIRTICVFGHTGWVFRI